MIHANSNQRPTFTPQMLLQDFTPLQFTLMLLAAVIIGLSKSGVKGIDMMNVTLMAIVFGGKASTGIVLPLLCIADLAAVVYYNRHAQWAHFWKLLPWIVIGILVGVFVGKSVDEGLFRKIMAVIILATVLIMVYIEFRKTPISPKNRLFATILGLVTGFTTMIGNLAGAFSNIYFMAMRMPKQDFIGTAAWLFLFINFFKLPFQIFYWNNITLTTLRTDLVLLPALALGFFVGLRIVQRIREEYYRRVVLALTLLGSVFMLLS